MRQLGCRAAHLRNGVAQVAHHVLQVRHHTIGILRFDLLIELTLGQLLDHLRDPVRLGAQGRFQLVDDHQADAHAQQQGGARDQQNQQTEATGHFAHLAQILADHLFLVIDKGIDVLEPLAVRRRHTFQQQG